MLDDYGFGIYDDNFFPLDYPLLVWLRFYKPVADAANGLNNLWAVRLIL